LAVGMLIGQRRPASRPFLLGFEVFGAMALALFIALAGCCPREVVMPYLVPFMARMEAIIGPGRDLVLLPFQCFPVLLLLGGPQVGFALVGGLLSRKFKISISPR